VAPRRSAKTLVSMMYVYGARAAGLMWTLAIIHQLDISNYGMYSLGVALSGILGQTLSNPYVVRAAREPEEDFVRERAGRYLLGLSLMILGQAFLPVHYVAWFGVTVAGGELIVGAYKARAMREGDPHLTSRIDTARGLGSVIAGCAYLYGAELFGLEPTLFWASVAYCLPYLVIAVLAAYTVKGHRPQLPGPPKTMLILAGEMLGTAAFLAGDVLLLGWLTNTTVVGYYTLAWVVASAVGYVGQAFGATYTQPLRDSGGKLESGPPLRFSVIIGLGGGILVLITGIVLIFTPVARELAIAMIIMSAYCAFRTVIMIFTLVLYAQGRDTVRLVSVIALVPFKFGLVALLAHLGAVGAAIATSVSDGLLLAIFAFALYGRGRYARRHDTGESDVPVVEGPRDGASG
jgi:hypothetical protein